MDDPIATALRHAQAGLRTVHATNKARRARLAAIVKDRLAYQEYVEARDNLDRAITSLYSKLQKKDGPKANKKKKKNAEPAPGASNGVVPNGLPMPSPAALGLITDNEHQVSIPEQLRQLVQTRRQWVDTVGSFLEGKERDSPGRIVGFPTSSIYEGIDEEVRQELERVSVPRPASPAPRPSSSAPTTNGLPNGNGYAKGKGKARADNAAMDIG